MGGTIEMPVTDPRAENCRKFEQYPDGKIKSVELVIKKVPNAKYRVGNVRLIDETEAGGTIVTSCYVVNEKGMPLGVPVTLAWPYPALSNFAVPSNPNNQHPTTSPYNPPIIGPLALCIREGDTIVSDIIGGIGLPFKHHVSFSATFILNETPEPSPPVTPLPPVDETAKAIEALHNTLKIIGKHFGAAV